MVEFVMFLIIILIVYTIFSQPVDIHFSTVSGLEIKLSFTFFSLSFEFQSHNKKKRKPPRGMIKLLLLFAGELISKSDVYVLSFEAVTSKKISLPTRVVLNSVIAPLLLAYIKSNSSFFTFKPTENTLGIDIIFSLSLYTLFISLLKASYYMLKQNIKRRVKDAG